MDRPSTRCGHSVPHGIKFLVGASLLACSSSRPISPTAAPTPPQELSSGLPSVPTNELWLFLPSTVYSIDAFDVQTLVRHPLFNGDLEAALTAVYRPFESLNLVAELVKCNVDLASRLRGLAVGEQNPQTEDDPALVFVMAGITRSDVEACLTTLEADHESAGELLRHVDDWYAWIDSETVLVGSGGLSGQGGLTRDTAATLLDPRRQVRSVAQMRKTVDALDDRAAARYVSFKVDFSAGVAGEIHIGDRATGSVRAFYQGSPERVRHYLALGPGRPVAEGEIVVWRTEDQAETDDMGRIRLLREALRVNGHR